MSLVLNVLTASSRSARCYASLRPVSSPSQCRNSSWLPSSTPHAPIPVKTRQDEEWDSDYHNDLPVHQNASHTRRRAAAAGNITRDLETGGVTTRPPVYRDEAAQQPGQYENQRLERPKSARNSAPYNPVWGPGRPRRPRPVLEPGQKQYYRFARIFGLDPATSLTDIVAGITETAPVGRVLSVYFEKKVGHTKEGKNPLSAFVLFDHEAGPRKLVSLAKAKKFSVRGACPFVAVYFERAFHANDHSETSSRVVRLKGRTNVADFNEQGIRNLLANNREVTKILGPLGLASETVITRDSQSGVRHMEWRFFDNQRQASVFVTLLRRHFYGKVSVQFGPDPCWDPGLYPRDGVNPENAMERLGVCAPDIRQRSQTRVGKFENSLELKDRVSEDTESQKEIAKEVAKEAATEDLQRKNPRLAELINLMHAAKEAADKEAAAQEKKSTPQEKVIREPKRDLGQRSPPLDEKAKRVQEWTRLLRKKNWSQTLREMQADIERS